MKFSAAFLASAAALLASTLPMATATPVAARDVFVPPITYPHAGTVWYIGQTHNVTWDTSKAPVNITNGKGIIMLRKGDLTTPVILQNNFDIRKGRIEVRVPWVVDGSDYKLVLFGDSGNFSPNFTIKGSGVAW
ncbi:hypothetical protein MIND_00924500 [Mycena indigotica]|uniref:Uncharacterized protein n=1 Tax=Mycena indigotica TaxID=2126181 RepID=A0A8H6VWY7_9AGAR|nr:uncharacterized protein MIND_00924500 [Mycena indigotica]KAF7296927.1 hypothetical protein MIND_00924500 [Mycena indigotica]